MNNMYMYIWTYYMYCTVLFVIEAYFLSDGGDLSFRLGLLIRIVGPFCLGEDLVGVVTGLVGVVTG